MGSLAAFISSRWSQHSAQRSARRSAHRRSALPGVESSRLTTRSSVYPPQLWPSSITWWGRLQRWLLRDNPWTPTSVRPVNRLAVARRDFRSVLERLHGIEASLLAYQIESARSLRELWHLRSDLYGQLALHFDQAEAERCMAGLNRHFPRRASRSVMGALGR